MKIAQEFKIFISRGNVIDLAVGVIIGAAFGKIVTSLVANMITPVLGILLGKINLAELALKFGQEGSEVVFGYGAFLQSWIDFVITAAAIFLLIKGSNSFQRKKEAAPTPPPEPAVEEKLLTEIRDLLRAQNAK